MFNNMWRRGSGARRVRGRGIRRRRRKDGSSLQQLLKASFFLGENAKRMFNIFIYELYHLMFNIELLIIFFFSVDFI